MFETVRDILIHMTEESIAILLSLSSALFVFLLIYWQYNRRRFRKLSHQIPAGVVKNYLDSVIQNSSAIKSSLFLGEDGEPTVVPIEKLSRDDGEGENHEELSRKNAEIAVLRNGNNIKDKIIAELEEELAETRSAKTSGSSGGEEALRKEIEKLKKQLQGQEPESLLNNDEISKLVQERDSLRDSLKEYEIIEDDLANLKSLQEENQRYREMIESMGGKLSDDVPPPPLKDEIVPEEKSDESDSNSEELLKEFEKMLGQQK